MNSLIVCGLKKMKKKKMKKKIEMKRKMKMKKMKKKMKKMKIQDVLLALRLNQVSGMRPTNLSQTLANSSYAVVTQLLR